MESLNAAKSAGAQFSDARIGRYLQNFVITREQQIVNVVDTDSIGIGVRALVNGTWGFAASRDLTKDGVAAAAREAVAIAKANRVAKDRSVQLAPAPSVGEVTWKSAYEIDPWTIPVEEKAELLLKANAEGMKAPNVKFVFSGLFFRKMERNYANTDGSVITQTIVQSCAAAAVHRGRARLLRFPESREHAAARRPRVGVDPAAGRREQARKWGEEASAEAQGQAGRGGPLRPACCTRRTSGSRSTSRSRTRPSSIARWATRPTTPARASSRHRRQLLGKLKYGPEFMNIQGDRSQAGALATIG